MTLDQTLHQMEALGTEQARKTYRRHGVMGDQYGVSYADIKNLAKKLKVNHDLAKQLWSSGVHDARLLALMIADPTSVDSTLLDSWANDLDSYPLSDALAQYVGRTPLAREKMEQWTKSDLEWTDATGWSLLGYLAMNDPSLSLDYFEHYLGIIECEVHNRKNRVRHTMNGALIAIGSRNPHLEERVVAVVKVTGKIFVDHGQTDCKTPDPVTYIEKRKARLMAKM